MAAASGAGVEYSGILPGNFLKREGADPRNPHLKLYISKLRKEVKAWERKQQTLAATEALKIQDMNDREDGEMIDAAGSEAEASEEDGEDVLRDQGGDEGVEGDEDDEENEASRRRPHREVSREEKAQLEARLLLARPLIRAGVLNADRNEVSSAYTLDHNVVIPGLESIMHRYLPHQLDGIGRYEHIMKTYGAVILGDDIGIGKTWIILAIIQRAVNKAQRAGRSVLIAVAVPGSLVSTWKVELSHSSTLRVAVASDKSIKVLSASKIRQDFDVILIPFGSLQSAYGNILDVYTYRQAMKEGLLDEINKLRRRLRDSQDFYPKNGDEQPNELVLSLDLDQLIVDEAQHIKNPDTVLAQALRAIYSKGRAAVTGTPLQNRVLEFGGLLVFLGVEPFCNLSLYRACFVHKATKDQKTNASTMLDKRRNSAALSALRSSLCIRRSADQLFDGEPITDMPIDMVSVISHVNQSPSSQEYQLETRDIWDPRWKAGIVREWKEAVDLLDQDSEEFHRRSRAYQELPRRDHDQTLRAMLHARMHMVHPKIIHAQYSTEEFGAKDPAMSITFRGRRNAFLKQFKGQDKEAWQSDRTFAVVEVVLRILQEHKNAASELSGIERQEYVATHKILVFCEFLAGLDLVAVALEQNHVEFLRFDGSLSYSDRDIARNLFEEKGKDFRVLSTRPDKHLVMLVTNGAGHEGINLVHGTDCLLMSPIWNPHTEDQIIGREARKGQKNTVSIYRFCSEDCIEERIRFLMIMKRAAVGSVLSDSLVTKHRDALISSTDEESLYMLGFERCLSALARGALVL